MPVKTAWKNRRRTFIEHERGEVQVTEKKFIERQKGEERQRCVYDVLDVLKKRGWISDWIPSSQYDPLDCEGGDVALTIIECSRYETLPLSVTGPLGLRDHQERNPDKPNIIVDLDMRWEKRRTLIELQLLLSTALERLRRMGNILEYFIRSAENGSRGWRIDFDVRRTDVAKVHLVVCSPGYRPLPPDRPREYERCLVFRKPTRPLFNEITAQLAPFVL